MFLREHFSHGNLKAQHDSRTKILRKYRALSVPQIVSRLVGLAHSLEYQLGLARRNVPAGTFFTSDDLACRAFSNLLVIWRMFLREHLCLRCKEQSRIRVARAIPLRMGAAAKEGFLWAPRLPVSQDTMPAPSWRVQRHAVRPPYILLEMFLQEHF